MKTIFLYIFLLFSVFSSTTLFAYEIFATKGIFEYGGSISSTGMFYVNSSDIKSQSSISIAPILNYYIFDNINIGFIPVFSYSYYDIIDEDTTYIKHAFSLGPQLSIGYTYNITDKVFIDFSPLIQYSYSKSFWNDDYNYSLKSMLYGFNLTLKYLIGNTIINIFINQGYRDYSSIDNTYIPANYYFIKFGLGISSFI